MYIKICCTYTEDKYPCVCISPPPSSPRTYTNAYCCGGWQRTRTQGAGTSYFRMHTHSPEGSWKTCREWRKEYATSLHWGP